MSAATFYHHRRPPPPHPLPHPPIKVFIVKAGSETDSANAAVFFKFRFAMLSAWKSLLSSADRDDISVEEWDVPRNRLIKVWTLRVPEGSDMEKRISWCDELMTRGQVPPCLFDNCMTTSST